MSKKGENIRKRKDGRWEGRYKRGYKDDGKILYGSVYGKSYREVKEKLLDAIFNEHNNSFDNKGADISLSDLLKMWLSANEMRLKAGTVTKYQTLINTHIIPALGSVKVQELSSTVINSYLNNCLRIGRIDGNGGLSPSYVRGIAHIISAAMRYGANEELCKPLNNQISKPGIIKKELAIFTREEQTVLERYIKENMSPTCIGIMISLYTGLRIGEVCALMWDDIDLNGEILYVRQTVSRIISDDNRCSTILVLDQPKTATSKRAIPIPSLLCKILVRYRDISQSVYVVSDNDGFVSPRTYEARYHRILIKCNISNLKYHALRHTFATRCVEVGVDVKSLSEILGHSNVSITLNTYVHSSLDMKKVQPEKLVASCGKV